jgi:hypothetical protein
VAPTLARDYAFGDLEVQRRFLSLVGNAVNGLISEPFLSLDEILHNMAGADAVASGLGYRVP